MLKDFKKMLIKIVLISIIVNSVVGYHIPKEHNDDESQHQKHPSNPEKNYKKYQKVLHDLENYKHKLNDKEGNPKYKNEHKEKHDFDHKNEHNQKNHHNGKPHQFQAGFVKDNGEKDFGRSKSQHDYKTRDKRFVDLLDFAFGRNYDLYGYGEEHRDYDHGHHGYDHGHHGHEHGHHGYQHGHHGYDHGRHGYELSHEHGHHRHNRHHDSVDSYDDNYYDRRYKKDLRYGKPKQFHGYGHDHDMRSGCPNPFYHVNNKNAYNNERHKSYMYNNNDKKIYFEMQHNSKGFNRNKNKFDDPDDIFEDHHHFDDSDERTSSEENFHHKKQQKNIKEKPESVSVNQRIEPQSNKTREESENFSPNKTADTVPLEKKSISNENLGKLYITITTEIPITTSQKLYKNHVGSPDHKDFDDHESRKNPVNDVVLEFDLFPTEPEDMFSDLKNSDELRTLKLKNNTNTVKTNTTKTDDVDNFNEIEYIELIPIIIEELKQNKVSKYQKYMLSLIYGDLWPIIVDESRRQKFTTFDEEMNPILQLILNLKTDLRSVNKRDLQEEFYNDFEGNTIELIHNSQYEDGPLKIQLGLNDLPPSQRILRAAAFLIQNDRVNNNNRKTNFDNSEYLDSIEAEPSRPYERRMIKRKQKRNRKIPQAIRVRRSSLLNGNHESSNDDYDSYENVMMNDYYKRRLSSNYDNPSFNDLIALAERHRLRRQQKVANSDVYSIPESFKQADEQYYNDSEYINDDEYYDIEDQENYDY